MLIRKNRSVIMPAYTQFAEVYDSYTGNRDYSSWADYILSLWEKYEIKPRKVLELACGTGSLVSELRARGFDTDGLDMSLAMLELAVEKVPGANFHHQDMRLMDLDGNFDSVVCFFDGMNYLLDEKDLEKVFRNVKYHLRDGGLFIFDLLSIHALKTLFESRKVIRNSPYTVVSEAKMQKNNQVMDFLLKFSFKDSGEKFNELHRFRGYDIRTVVSLLEMNDFELVAKFGGYTQNPPKSNSERIVFVARKS